MSFRLSHIHDYNRFISIDLWLYRARAGIYDVTGWVFACTGFSSVRQSRKNFSDGAVLDIWGIWDSLEQAIMQAWEHIESIPDDVIMSFPSQAFISDLLTTQYSREDQYGVLTMQEIDTMIKRIEKTSYERARVKSQKKFWIISDDLKLISSTIVSIQIDGKSVSSPIWFTGSRVRLTVLNVFVPSWEFNVMRSIVSRLGKKIISLIPEPLILPKLIEETDAIMQNSCLIDIGYGHTTVTVLQKNEIIWFETFSYGTEMLMESISLLHPQFTLLQIENIICSPQEFQLPEHKECLEEFLEYIQDAILGYFQAEDIDLKFNFLFLHGNIFANKAIFQQFGNLIEDSLGYEIKKKQLHELVQPKIKHDQCIVHGLALMARELLLIKKDPLIRILRYVLYQYE
jgi:hypothetical protein